jgi:hypothetical protein
VAVGAGGEGAEKDGGGHESTRSALQWREALPFAASASVWCRAQRSREGEKGRMGGLQRAGATCLVVATAVGISGRTSTWAWEDDDALIHRTYMQVGTRLGLGDSSQLPRLNVAGTLNGSVQVLVLLCRDSMEQFYPKRCETLDPFHHPSSVPHFVSHHGVKPIAKTP